MAEIETITFNRFKQLELQGKLESSSSFLLLGPRQTGKSTILANIFDAIPEEEQLRYYFQLPSQREIIESDPEVILRAVEAKRKEKPICLLIDEIQKIPKVMDVLQFLIDQKKIVLAACGSSARKMKRMGTNWLPGRIFLEYLSPLSWQECGLIQKPDNFKGHLLFGFLPGIVSKVDLKQKEELLASYAHLYLDEEIKMEAVVRNLPKFTKFLRLAALESGTSPNHTKISNQVGLSHTSIRDYFQILEDTLIIYRLEAFGTSRDSVLKTPKYYFFDVGVRNAAAPIGHSEGILQLQMGVLFEHFIIQEIMCHLQHKAPLSHWRSKQDHEVDLIIEKDGGRIAVEIKATDKPVAADFKGLDVFREKYGCKTALLVCQTSVAQKFGNFLAIPWQKMWEYI
ncbi:MAG: ATP-binding protein [Deltaproteobacteria bacterium]|nr:ATP-binding protein [Deltaproteobacteria bacterium]